MQKKGGAYEVERRLEGDGKTYLYAVRWEERGGRMVKRQLRKLGSEPPPVSTATPAEAVPAICWSYGRTLGNIAVYSKDILAQFPADSEGEATLPCAFIETSLARNGKPRWWCQVHQTYWGRKADLQYAEKHGRMSCGNSWQPMWYVKDPKTFATGMQAELGVWCGLGAALSSRPILKERPRIHVHIRDREGGPKQTDNDYTAISIKVAAKLELFGDKSRIVHITPPAALAYLRAKEEGWPVTTIECGKCKSPHLDLGEFAQKPHLKHICGNCGWDHTRGDGPGSSNPLFRLFERTADNTQIVPARKKHLDLDKYADLDWDVWASTPAIVWTAKRPQESGIHVHVFDQGREIINDTYAEVTYKGKPLNRGKLYKMMLDNTILDETPTDGTGMM